MSNSPLEPGSGLIDQASLSKRLEARPWYQPKSLNRSSPHDQHRHGQGQLTRERVPSELASMTLHDHEVTRHMSHYCIRVGLCSSPVPDSSTLRIARRWKYRLLHPQHPRARACRLLHKRLQLRLVLLFVVGSQHRPLRHPRAAPAKQAAPARRTFRSRQSSTTIIRDYSELKTAQGSNPVLQDRRVPRVAHVARVPQRNVVRAAGAHFPNSESSRSTLQSRRSWSTQFA